MLLSTDSYGADLVFSFADLGETSLNRLVDRVDPNPRILLHVPSGQAGDQFVILLRGRQNSARLEVDDDGFGALGTAIDANVEHTKQEIATD